MVVLVWLYCLPFYLEYIFIMGLNPDLGFGQEVFQTSRVESGRVGSGEEVFEISRAGSGGLQISRD